MLFSYFSAKYAKKRHLLKDKIQLQPFLKMRKFTKSPVTILTISHDKHKVLFSVSKKHLARAVDRNKIKRQMRAIYFKNKELFIENQQKLSPLFILQRTNPIFNFRKNNDRTNSKNLQK